MANALCPQSLDDPIGVRAQLVGHHDHAAEVTIDANDDMGLARASTRHHGRGRDLPCGDACGANERAASDSDAAAVDRSLNALAWLLRHLARRADLELGFDGRPEERLAENVRRHLIDGGSQPQYFPLLEAVAAEDLTHLGRADGEGARLVEQHSARLAQRLDRPGALHDHACVRRAREPRDQRDRRRQDQRTRCGHHHHSKRPDRFAAEPPRRTSCQQRRGEEEPGVAVCHPHERRPVRLGLLDQPHKRSVGTLGCRSIGPNLARRARVRRAAEHPHTQGHGDGERLPAQGAGVQDGLTAHERSVNRHHLARADNNDIAGLHLLDRHLLDVVADPAPRSLRGTLDQRCQLSSSTRRSHVLERRAT